MRFSPSAACPLTALSGRQRAGCTSAFWHARAMTWKPNLITGKNNLNFSWHKSSFCLDCFYSRVRQIFSPPFAIIDSGKEMP